MHMKTKESRFRCEEGRQKRSDQIESSEKGACRKKCWKPHEPTMAVASFTAEAAFVLPVIFGALLLMIYLFLYQYDRCLLEQDMGNLALWGSTIPVESAAKWKQQLEHRASSVYQDKYAAWETTDIHVELKNNQVLVKGKGILHFPLPGWNIWSQENAWTAEIVYKTERLSPVFFIRQYHKLKGERE